MTSESNLVRLGSRPAQPDRLGWMATGAVVLSWLYLNGPTLHWLMQAVQEISWFNRWMLVAGAALLLVQGWRYRQELRFSAVPVLRGVPLFFMVGGALGAIATRWLLNFDQLPVVFGLLGTYGLLGLFLNATAWRKGVPVGMAIALILPFGMQFSSGLGFPARILTAHVVEFILKTWHIAALSSEDIIVLDTGIAQVDLPCSGLKSLWTGTLFLLAATWLEGRRFGLCWLLVFGVNLGMLAIANVARVLTLVLVAQVEQQPVIAGMLHVPLGLVTFVAACGLTWGLLRWVPVGKGATDKAEQEQLLFPRATGRVRQVAPFALALVLMGLTLVPQPAVISAPVVDLSRLTWPTEMRTQAIALNPVEQEFFGNYPGVSAQKRRFEFQGLTGSVLLVASPTSQAQHAPELCLTGSGYRIDQLVPHSFSPELLGRWLSLNGGTKTAVYWFQSPRQTTGDFLVRVWQDASRQDSTWTLVSVLFDQSHQPDEPVVQQFLVRIHNSLEQTLQDV